MRRIALAGCLGAAALAVLAACGGDARERRAASAHAHRVSELLYERKLVADPEVNARMNEFVLAVSRDGADADSVMAEFGRWLEAWARAHPERAAAARLE